MADQPVQPDDVQSDAAGEEPKRGSLKLLAAMILAPLFIGLSIAIYFAVQLMRDMEQQCPSSPERRRDNPVQRKRGFAQCEAPWRCLDLPNVLYGQPALYWLRYSMKSAVFSTPNGAAMSGSP